MTERINVAMTIGERKQADKLAARLSKKTGVTHTVPDAMRWALAQAVKA